MIKVQCPTCNVQLSAPPEFAGRTVSCQQCKSKFVVPSAAPAAVVQPSSQPTIVNAPKPAPAATPPATSFQQPTAPNFGYAEPGSQGGVAIRARAGKGVELVESQRLGDLFDFRFNRFLTPKLARLLYIFAMVAAVIAFCVGTFMFIRTLTLISSVSSLPQNSNQSTNLVFHQEKPLQVASLGVPDAELLGQLNSPFSTSSIPSKTSVILDLIWGYVLSLFSLFMFVLVARLVLEAALVNFHNGLKLASIETNTKPV